MNASETKTKTEDKTGRDACKKIATTSSDAGCREKRPPKNWFRSALENQLEDSIRFQKAILEIARRRAKAAVTRYQAKRDNVTRLIEHRRQLIKRRLVRKKEDHGEREATAAVGG